jgi:hypothetical protein
MYRYKLLSSWLLVLVWPVLASGQECSRLTVNQEWPTGMHGTLAVAPDHNVHNWNLVLTFDISFNNFIVRITTSIKRIYFHVRIPDVCSCNECIFFMHSST